MKYFLAAIFFSSLIHAQDVVHLSGTNEVLSFRQQYREVHVDHKKMTVESVCLNGNNSNILQGSGFEFCSKEIDVPTCNVAGLPLKRKSIQYQYACFRGTERIVEGILVYTLNYYDPCNRSVEVEYCEIPRTISTDITVEVVNQAGFSGSSLILTNGSLGGILSNDVLLGYKENSSTRSIDNFNIIEEKKIEVKIEDLSPFHSTDLSNLDYVFSKKKLMISMPLIDSDLVMFQLVSYKKSWWMRNPSSWGAESIDQSIITDGSISFSFDTFRRGNYLFEGSLKTNPQFKYLFPSVFQKIKNQRLSFEAKI